MEAVAPLILDFSIMSENHQNSVKNARLISYSARKLIIIQCIFFLLSNGPEPTT